MRRPESTSFLGSMRRLSCHQLVFWVSDVDTAGRRRRWSDEATGAERQYAKLGV
jgi:hypothetical protein